MLLVSVKLLLIVLHYHLIVLDNTVIVSRIISERVDGIVALLVVSRFWCDCLLLNLCIVKLFRLSFPYKLGSCIRVRSPELLDTYITRFCSK